MHDRDELVQGIEDQLQEGEQVQLVQSDLPENRSEADQDAGGSEIRIHKAFDVDLDLMIPKLQVVSQQSVEETIYQNTPLEGEGRDVKVHAQTGEPEFLEKGH